MKNYNKAINDMRQKKDTSVDKFTWKVFLLHYYPFNFE